MKRRFALSLSSLSALCVALVALGGSAAVLLAEEPGDQPAAAADKNGDGKNGDAAKAETPKSDPVKADAPAGSASSGGSGGGASSGAPAPRPKYPPFADVLKDFTKVDGLITLYHKDSKLYAEIGTSQLNRDFIVLTSIARGIAEGQLLGGMSWGFGDDWLWQFRKVDDGLHVVRRNVRFRAARGTPEERAVRFAYTDSVLFNLPIVTMGPSGGFVVDFSQMFMSDLPQIGAVMPGFNFSPSRSTYAEVKGFRDNVELEVAAVYGASPNLDLDTVPDNRGIGINVHYSISLLPDTGYAPRLADDRVGYFLTVVKDFSKKGADDNFVRYINRWDLQKADPSAEFSPPKKPVVFWLERTVPFQYRKAISDGILEWNKAYEKAGIVNAIEVRQQPDNAEWDPEDINYNTFRWITSGAGFAMGPSRVNPMTGQILDADIIFDADFVRFWKMEYETYSPESIAALTGGPIDLDGWRKAMERIPTADRHSFNCRCELHNGMTRELAFGATALAAAAKGADAAKEVDKMIQQGLKEVAMHEVGHTLGLRHNFKASTLLNMDEMNDVAKTSVTGLTASVMDYNPTNIAPKGAKQGEYYSSTIGPYDYWAIEYGYKPFSGGTDAETAELKKIASRCAEPALAYATDEDTRGIDSDPLVNRFDFGKEPIDYAKARTEMIEGLWDGIVGRVTKDGDGYQRARQAFGVLLGNYGSSLFFASRYVGGIYVNRDHKGDKNERPPFVIVPADKQRAALKLIEQRIFSEKPFDFPPELYNHLAASRWNHWGMRDLERLDYPVHDVILMWQDRILDQLLSTLTLKRLYDSELKVAADTDALTVAELMETLTKSIFAEVLTVKPGDYTNRKQAVSSVRRNLQRSYLKRLSSIVLGPQSSSASFGGMTIVSSGSRVPEDVQSLAHAQLRNLDAALKKALASKVKLDDYTRAHLQDSQERIRKVLESQVTTSRP